MKHKILYVDSDSEDLDNFKSTFKSYYEIYTAASVQESTEILEENEIHLILIEDKLLEMEFLGSLVFKYPDTIKMLTGLKDNIDLIIKAINFDSAHRYITKPWNEKKLKLTIDHALRNFVKQQENEHLVDNLQYMLRRMNFLHEISQQISEKKVLPELLGDIMESSKIVMNAEASSLLLYDANDNKLYFHVAKGEKGKLIKQFSVDIGDGIAGWVAKNRKPLLIEDCYKDPRFDPEYDKKTNFKTKSMICVPLMRKNQLVGVMQVINRQDDGVFESRDLTIFETLASQCAVAIENARFYTNMTELNEQLKQEMIERKRSEEERIRIEAEDRRKTLELEHARIIQQQFLPLSLPEVPYLEIAAFQETATEVGGDYYDFFEQSNGQFRIAFGDATGHGVGAGLVVAATKTALLMVDEDNLSEMLERLNIVLKKANLGKRENMALVLIRLIYDEQSSTIHVQASGGGMTPLYIIRSSGGVEEIIVPGLPLGIIENFKYQAVEFSLTKSDVLLMASDGLVERMDDKKDILGYDRLMEKLEGIGKNYAAGVDDTTAFNILDSLVEIGEDWSKNTPQDDDATFVVLKVK